MSISDTTPEQIEAERQKMHDVFNPRPQTTPLQRKLADVGRLGDECRKTNGNPSVVDAFNTKFAEMLIEARKSFGLEER